MLRVLERHEALDPSIGAFNLSLKPAAEGYIQTYDALRMLGLALDRELAEGKAKVSVLGAKLSSYVGQVEATNAIEGFDAQDYDGTTNVPDDVISDSEAFLEVVKAQVEANPESLPMGQGLIEDLSAAIEVAKAEWKEADGLKAEHRALIEQNRESARALSALLVAFRRVLGRAVGRSHPDYQTLRAAKVDREVLEEGEEDGLPEHLVPSSEGDAGDDSEQSEAG